MWNQTKLSDNLIRFDLFTEDNKMAIYGIFKSFSNNNNKKPSLLPINGLQSLCITLGNIRLFRVEWSKFQLCIVNKTAERLNRLALR